MYSIKDFNSEDFSCRTKANKQWLKTKKVIKKLAHKQLRKRKLEDTSSKYIYRGYPIAW